MAGGKYWGAVLLVSAGAWAQTPELEVIQLPDDAEPEIPAKPAAVVEEIVVTAQRRRESLLDVPIAVTALGPDALRSRGIERIDELNSIAPGLQISRSPANTTISQITIRGSSQINPALYWDPAVGLYLDGVYIGKAQGSVFDVADLAGVEVLRGPQGTLYGRNTIAGTINLVTRKPSGAFGGRAGVEFGRYQQQVYRATLDLPRIGPVAAKVGARSERRDGWVSTTESSPVDELNNRHNDAVQLTALFDIATGLDAVYRYDRSDTDQTNNYLQLVRHENPASEPWVARERQHHADIDSISFERADTQGHALTLSWTLGEAFNIKSITARRTLNWADSLDLDGSPQMLAHTQRFTDYQQFSQDLNIGGRLGAVQYTGGLYWFTDDGYTNNPQTFYEGSLNFDSRYGTETRAWAAYGQADWTGIERLTLTFGLRHTRETKTLERVLGFAPAPDENPIPGLEDQGGAGFVYYIAEGFRTPDAAFDATTPLLSAAWKFSDQLNTYIRYAEGFKSGGYNGEYSNLQDTPDDGNPDTSNDNQAQTLVPFRPERQRSIELGLKAHALDGLLSANVALFQNKLEDLQASIFTGGGAAATVVRNAGRATVRGLEIETVLRPFTGTRLSASLSLLDAKYDVFDDEDAEGNFGNQADNRAFVHAPEKAFNLVLDSHLATLLGGGVRAVVDYVWTDSFYTYPYQLSGPGDPGYDDSRQVAGDSQVQAYGLLNARLIWERAEHWSVALWGRNLLNENAANNYIDFGPGLFQSLTIANFVEPRTVGLAATYGF